MQSKYKVYIRRNLESNLDKLLKNNQSALIFGPRQTGKTTLVKKCLSSKKNVVEYPLQNPKIRQEMESDPSLIIRQIEAQQTSSTQVVFIDEAQKVPPIFDSAQYLIDEQKASFIITGSSARKLRRKGMNLLPGRVKSFRLDPLLFNEFGWVNMQPKAILPIKNINKIPEYSFEKSLVYGALPGIVALADDTQRKDILTAYSHIYIEEEIRAEALSRKIGAFGRFVELAARESGTSPNLTKLSLESGVSVPTIKEFFNILEDTLVVEKVEPYLKNTRKRIMKTPRYYFFDIGVRNALARFPLTNNLVNIEKGRLFEHFVVLEIIRRIRALNLDYKVYYWRTGSGLEVDCVIDTGFELIPIEIKAGEKVKPSDIKGLLGFVDLHKRNVKEAFVVNNGRLPQKLGDKITVIPWTYL